MWKHSKLALSAKRYSLPAIVSHTTMKRCELLGLIAVRIQSISGLQRPLAG